MFQQGWSFTEHGKKAEMKLVTNPYDLEAWSVLVREAQVANKKPWTLVCRLLDDLLGLQALSVSIQCSKEYLVITIHEDASQTFVKTC